MRERIPEKTEALTLTGKDVRVAAQGLEVTLYAENADVYIKMHPSVPNAQAFIIKQGDRLCLSGDFVASGTGATLRLLYCRVL